MWRGWEIFLYHAGLSGGRLLSTVFLFRGGGDIEKDIKKVKKKKK